MTATALRERSVGSTVRLTREDEVELAKRIERDDKAAREQLIMANQGLIWHVLRTEFRGFIYLWDDLFQEGQVGLIKAVDRFDWRRGCKFSSYAVWWIRREIQLALGRWWTGAARIPESRLKELRAFNLATQKLADRLSRPPTPEEIAGELGVPLDNVYDLLKMMVAGRRLVSLEALEERGRSVMHLVADESLPDAEEGLEPRLRHSLRRVIGVSLTEKQRQVICLRYGLDLDGEPLRPLSQREIAQQMDITPQAVSRIEERALARIRAEMDLITQSLRRID
ncbi:MAG: RNA polymerase sigma factor RpoD [Candidatus Bipolaricaulis sibiricus]|uniref:RNA polymerase sigma factor n=1 Tax=Bipolaricaulis sibiricus TaxID=2501609 RepID=A0A410FS72_BIPS1|nr:MAG: RNA polymerase sigma factor RpoD [Candidatus Bipolaricaulis sibiricus]